MSFLKAAATANNATAAAAAAAAATARAKAFTATTRRSLSMASRVKERNSRRFWPAEVLLGTRGGGGGSAATGQEGARPCPRSPPPPRGSSDTVPGGRRRLGCRENPLEATKRTRRRQRDPADSRTGYPGVSASSHLGYHRSASKRGRTPTSKNLLVLRRSQKEEEGEENAGDRGMRVAHLPHPRRHRSRRSPSEAGVAGEPPPLLLPPADRTATNNSGHRAWDSAAKEDASEGGAHEGSTTGQLAVLLRALEAANRAAPACFTAGTSALKTAASRGAPDAAAAENARSLDETLRGYSEAGEWQLALDLLSRMLSGGTPLGEGPPDARSFSVVVSACAKAGRWREATDLVCREMPAHGVTPAAATCREAIDACGRSGRWQEAVGLLEGMVEAGLEPSVSTYNAVITLCGSVGRFREAVCLLDQMLPTGAALRRPNLAASYNSAMTACAHAGEWQRALDLFRRMWRDGVRPNVGSYNIAIGAVGDVGDCGAALSLLREMSHAGVAPNTNSYSAVVRSFVQADRMDDAAVSGLLEEMSESTSMAAANLDRITICGVDIDLSAAGSSGGQTSKRWRQAVGLAREVEGSVGRASTLVQRSAAGDTVACASPAENELPNDSTASGKERAVGEEVEVGMVGVNAGRDGRLETLTRLKGMSAGAEMPQTAGSYSLAITKCGHEGRWRDALALLRQMSAASGGVPPTRKCYHSAIGACGSANRHEEALALLREMPRNGLALTERSYRCAISALGNAGRVDECVSLLREARAAGLPPSPGSYSLAIMACGDAGRWERGLSLLKEAEALDIVASGACYNAAAKACRDCGRVEEAVEVMERCRRAEA